MDLTDEQGAIMGIFAQTAAVALVLAALRNSLRHRSSSMTHSDA